MKLSDLVKAVDGKPLTTSWTKWAADLHKHRDTSEHQDGSYHPSQLTGCPAMLFLVIEGFPLPPEPFDPVGQRIFNNGDAVHERLQVQFARAGILETSQFDYSTEVPIEIPEYNIVGHTDGILNFGPRKDTGQTLQMFGKTVPKYSHSDDSQRYILEIKSINERGFIEIEKRGKPKDEHIAQASIYCWAKDIPNMIVLYESKNRQTWQEFVVPMDRDAIKATQDKIKLIESWRAEYRKTGKIPKGVHEAAKETAKDRKPWGLYAQDFLRPHLGEPSLEEQHQKMLKNKQLLQRRK